MTVPPRLLAFAEWLKDVDHGTLGYFDVLAGEPLDDVFVDDAVRTIRSSTPVQRTRLGPEA